MVSQTSTETQPWISFTNWAMSIECFKPRWTACSSSFEFMTWSLRSLVIVVYVPWGLSDINKALFILLWWPGQCPSQSHPFPWQWPPGSTVQKEGIPWTETKGSGDFCHSQTRQRSSGARWGAFLYISGLVSTKLLDLKQMGYLRS